MKKKVRYTDPIGNSWLERDIAYEVEKEDEDYYWINTKSYSLQPFIKSRFEVVPEPPKKKVRCISTEGTLYLQFGKIYEVYEETEENYLIKIRGESPTAYIKGRFEVVNDPSKEVKYYEVIKRPPLSTWDKGEIITNSVLFEECARFPEFFRPVYREQFKAGDWVAIEHPNWKHGIVQLTEVTEEVFKSKERSYWYRTSEFGEKTRLATKEEIEGATSVSIGGYEMNIFQGDKARFAGYTFTRDEIRAIRLLVASCINAEITIRGEKLTVAKLNKILNKLK